MQDVAVDPDTLPPPLAGDALHLTFAPCSDPSRGVLIARVTAFGRYPTIGAANRASDADEVPAADLQIVLVADAANKINVFLPDLAPGADPPSFAKDAIETMSIVFNHQRAPAKIKKTIPYPAA